MASQVDGALPTHPPSNSLSLSEAKAHEVAQEWLTTFGAACEQGDVATCLSLIWEEGFWRDLLPLTWSYRSLGGKAGGKARIKQVLDERLGGAGFTNFKLDAESAPVVLQLFEDLSFIMVTFTFDCKAGPASGIARLVPGAKGNWEAFTISTLLEGLHGVDEKLGGNRDINCSTGAKSWLDSREEEFEFANRSPETIIIGAGQSGLNIAARLKALGVDTLCVDRHPRVGDAWRKRYASLRLHDPVQYDHMAYLPFPDTWPTYTPGPKIANWMVHYAETLELNIWTSSTVVSAVFNDAADNWSVVVDRGMEDGSVQRRTFTPKIVVWACGLGGGEKNMPVIEGMDKFKGKILHSSEHGTGKDWAGKTAVVVGACTSAHDISKDFYDQGTTDITMVQRSSTYIMSVEKGMPLMMAPLYVEGGPPTEVADRINASIPNAVMKELHKRVAKYIQAADKDLLDGLHKRGFQTNQGEDDSGFLMMAWAKAGGYYLDTQASSYIIDGRIKLQSGHGGVKKFTDHDMILDDGTVLKNVDVAVFATGYGDARVAIRKALGDKIADQCRPFWGLDYEREINGCWAGSGVKNFFLFAGNLALCRFNSKLVALQIKAMIDGKFKDSDRCEL